MKRLASITLLLCLAACGSTPLQERFYTLASEPAPATTANASLLIVVGPVTVPEIVDRPQFVLRGPGNRVDIDEEARWAAPLKSEIPRVIADHLARLVESARIATSTDRASGVPDYRVMIDVQRFESAPDGVTVQAAWNVTSRGGGAPVAGRSVVTEPAGAGYDALVAAHSRALEKVSQEIATAINSLNAKPLSR